MDTPVEVAERVNSTLAFNQQVALLEKKRAVLLGLIRLTEALEQLRTALQAVLQLGVGERLQLALSDMRAFERIRARVTGLSDSELRGGIHRLDQRVRQSLAEISQLALQLVDDTQTSLADLERINPRINEFNRYARTSIAMRVLLELRGQRLPPLQFELPRSEIERSLAGVEHKEQSICQALVLHIGDMRSDLALLLGNQACAPNQREFYAELDQALATNLAHIEAGLSLSELPMPMDAIEVSADAPAAQSDESQRESEMLDPLEAPANSAGGSPAVAPLGFVSRLRAWLSSPWSVRWRDLPKKPPGR